MKRRSRAKRATVREPEMLDHYDFSGGVRGEYAAAYKEGVIVRVTAKKLPAKKASKKRSRKRTQDQQDVAAAKKALAEHGPDIPWKLLKSQLGL